MDGEPLSKFVTPCLADVVACIKDLCGCWNGPIGRQWSCQAVVPKIQLLKAAQDNARNRSSQPAAAAAAARLCLSRLRPIKQTKHDSTLNSGHRMLSSRTICCLAQQMNLSCALDRNHQKMGQCARLHLYTIITHLG